MRTFLHHAGKVEEVTNQARPPLPALPPLPEDERHPRPRPHSGRTGKPIAKCNLVGLDDDGTVPPSSGTRPKQIKRRQKVAECHKAKALIVCAVCGKPWERKPKRGRPWTKCPKCR